MASYVRPLTNRDGSALVVMHIKHSIPCCLVICLSVSACLSVCLSAYRIWVCVFCLSVPHVVTFVYILLLFAICVNIIIISIVDYTLFLLYLFVLSLIAFHHYIEFIFSIILISNYCTINSITQS